jgi:hypothetical protein
MKRLRHPIRAIREPFGKAGLILACIALIAAVGGTAYAATKLNGTQKKEVEKIAKKYAGKDGAPGAAGTNGTNGTNGKDGTAGEKGEKGEKGDTGNAGGAGAAGKSVVTGEFSGSGGNCHEGGATVEQEGNAGSKKYVCNGEEGEEGHAGANGNPWTPNNTLPSGATETGAWTIPSGFEGSVQTAISFPVKLPAELDEAHVGVVIPGGAAELTEQHVGTVNAPPVNCLGSPAAPSAPAGFLCVYMSSSTGAIGIPTVFNLESPLGNGASTAGAIVTDVTNSTTVAVYGTWAVTAP